MHQTQPISKTAIVLAVLCLCLLGMLFFCLFTIGFIEHYMNLTPADWPYPGSFWDRANDFTCFLILLPSLSVGTFSFWLLFFPVPIAISVYRRDWKCVIFYTFCIAAPSDYIAYVFQNFFVSSALYLVLILCIPPFLIKTWSSLCPPGREKQLMQACLTLVWIIFCGANLLLGLGVHANDCKPGIAGPLTELETTQEKERLASLPADGLRSGGFI